MLAWYMKRYDILLDFFIDLRVLLRLRENSDPAETLKIIKERLDQTTTKELKDDKENS